MTAKIFISTVVIIALEGCAASGAVTAAVPLAEAGMATCSNPLSPVLCQAETTAVIFAEVYGCTPRESFLNVNGCAPGRTKRIYDEEGTLFDRLNVEQKEAKRKEYIRKQRENNKSSEGESN